MVLLVGAMLACARPSPEAWWFVPLALLLVRPLSTLPAIVGERLALQQATMMAWFGIRGLRARKTPVSERGDVRCRATSDGPGELM